MIKTSNHSGFTLIEMALGLGLVSVIVASLLSVMNVMSKQSAEITNSSWANDLRFEVINAINNKVAFETHTKGSNSNLSCIDHDDDCGGHGGTIQLMDSGGSAIRLVSSPTSPSQGITRRGTVCNTFGTSPDCPFRYEVSWTPICGLDGGCKDPQVQVNAKMVVSPVAGNLGNFRPEKFNLRVNRVEKGTTDIAKICGSLGGSMSGAKCILSVNNPCTDPARPYLLGYDSNGITFCGYESTNTHCPAGGVLTSLNSDGTYSCMAGCSGGGAGGGNFGFAY